MIRSAKSATFSTIIRLCQQSNDNWPTDSSMKLESLEMLVKSTSPPRIISILAFPLPSEKQTLNTNLIRCFLPNWGTFPVDRSYEYLAEVPVTTRYWPMISWWQVQEGGKVMVFHPDPLWTLWIVSHVIKGRDYEDPVNVACAIEYVSWQWHCVSNKMCAVIYPNWIGNPTWQQQHYYLQPNRWWQVVTWSNIFHLRRSLLVTTTLSTSCDQWQGKTRFIGLSNNYLGGRTCQPASPA